mgnify:FL=1
MKRKVFFICLFIIIPLLSISQENEYETKWEQGYKFNSSDGHFKMKFGGRIMNDWAFFSQEEDVQDKTGKINNGTEFRRVRVFNSGTIYNNINYKLQLGFAGGTVKAKDLYIEITDIPVAGNLKIGHYKEPFSLEKLTSSKYISFMERSSASAFAPGRNTGFLLHNETKQSRLSWQIGMFTNANDFGNNKNINDYYSYTARIAGLPFQKNDKKQLLHTGIGVTYRQGMSGPYSFSARPEAHLAEKYVNTGDIEEVQNVFQYNTELAYVSGPLALQGEFYQSAVTTNSSDSYKFHGGYGQISYLITGENKSYKNPGGGFGRIKPNENFGGEKNGTGAWEVAVRYSMIDLNDHNGGKMNEVTAGLNWYLNPSVRIMANYGIVTLHDIGKTDILQLRFQIDF